MALSCQETQLGAFCFVNKDGAFLPGDPAWSFLFCKQRWRLPAMRPSLELSALKTKMLLTCHEAQLRAFCFENKDVAYLP
jgi:hypothetical protein